MFFLGVRQTYPKADAPLFQDYFSAHGQDALLIAQTVYKTTNVIRYLGSPTSTTSSTSASSSTNQKKGLPSLTLSMALAKGFLREALTSKQMRVEIWEGEGGKKQGNRWVLGKEVSTCNWRICSLRGVELIRCVWHLQASPGNIQQLEDLLFTSTDNFSSPIVMALKLVLKDGGATRLVGAAFADASARRLGISEFLDDEMFSNTEVSCGPAINSVPY